MPKKSSNDRRFQLIAGRRRAAQQGSALLIVLVFAAIVAIMLYRELPVVAFEAQRQREELTVSRGNSYKRAVKLFVRKIGRFPSTIDELENTNRMRFLPHRYVDPLTGKDDWRLIHAGPGGIITDSKIPANKGTATSTLGQAATFAGFNNSFSGDAAAAADAAAANAANPGLRQRAAATKNAASVQQPSDGLGLPQGSEDPNATQQPGQADQSNAIPNGLQPGSAQNTGLAGAGSINNPNGLNNGGISPSALAAATGNGINTLSQQLNNTNPQSPELSPQQNAQQNPQQNGLSNTASFGSPTNLPQQGTGNGQLNGSGGIAGVASKALGTGIKSVNDQTKYALWEFYYDLRKDQQGGAAAATGQPNGANGNLNNSANTNSSGFGSNSAFGANNSGFGSSSGFGTGNNNAAGANGSTSGFGSSGSFGQNQSQSGFSSTNPPPPAQQSNPPIQQQ